MRDSRVYNINQIALRHSVLSCSAQKCYLHGRNNMLNWSVCNLPSECRQLVREFLPFRLNKKNATSTKGSISIWNQNFNRT